MAVTSTTLAGAKATGDKTIVLTSATGIANKMLVNSATQIGISFLFVK
jgi:hypothetical protein